MTLVWTMSFLGVAAISYHLAATPARLLFPWIAAVGVVAGVVDILLFLRIPEPENQRHEGRRVLHILIEPLLHREYRSFLRYTCGFAASAMLAAAFMQIYALEVLAMPVWQANLVWCMAGIGNALVAKFWGRIADQYGHRPIFLLCTCFKPVVALAFLLVTPRFALPILATVFLFDNMLNCGNTIAGNGYMLKMAPRRNRSAFVAASTALAGICGGLSAVIGGVFLRSTAGFQAHFLGRQWTNYQVLFLCSFGLRLACIILAARIREPVSASPLPILMRLRNVWPMRTLLFPVGLYRRIEDGENGEQGEGQS
jgi:predicted MFS family arabinose efflux permease